MRSESQQLILLGKNLIQSGHILTWPMVAYVNIIITWFCMAKVSVVYCILRKIDHILTRLHCIMKISLIRPVIIMTGPFCYYQDPWNCIYWAIDERYPNLTLMNVLCGVYCEDFRGNWQALNCTLAHAIYIYIYILSFSPVYLFLTPGVRFTKPISSVPLIFPVFNTTKTLVSYCISLSWQRH